MFSKMLKESESESQPESQAESRTRLVPSVQKRPEMRPIPLYQRTSIGPVLNRVMEWSGTHQAEVARRMRIRPQSLNQYVKGKRARPSLDWLLHFLAVNGAGLAVVFPSQNLAFQHVRSAAELGAAESQAEAQPELDFEAS